MSYNEKKPAGEYLDALRGGSLRDSFFLNNPMPVLVIDPDNGRIYLCNPAAAEYYGYSTDELCELNILDINHGTTEEIRLEMQAAEAEKRNFFNFRHRHSDGTVREVEVVSVPIDVEGKKLLYSTIIDTALRKNRSDRLVAENHTLIKELSYRTAQLEEAIGVQEELNAALEEELEERNKAERALGLKESHYRLLFNSLVTGYAVHEMIYDERGLPSDYRFLDMNPAFEAMTGLRHESAVGRTVLELLPNTETYWIETYDHVVRTGETVRIENKAAELDKYFEVLAFRPQENQFSVLVTDVTQKRRNEVELLEQKLIFEALFRNSPVAAIQFDASHEALEINNAFEILFGYHQEEIRGIDVDRLIAVED